MEKETIYTEYCENCFAPFWSKNSLICEKCLKKEEEE